MKNVFILVFASILMMGASCSETKSTTKTNFDKETMSDKEKASYALGVNIFENFKTQGLENIDISILAQAMNDVKAGKEDLAVASADAMGAIQTFQQAEMKIISKKADGESAKFFEENAKKEGVQTTASGLQYKVLTAGTGAQPTATDKVKVHYKGTLLDGSVFDSSYERNEPTSFGVGQVIPGWTEGLQLMKVGSKYKFFIPAKLGYGARGAGAKIPPSSTLIFEVELLDIEAPAPKK